MTTDWAFRAKLPPGLWVARSPRELGIEPEDPRWDEWEYYPRPDGHSHRCRAPRRGDRKRCAYRAIPGGVVCRYHGGNLPSVRRAAVKKIERYADAAVQALGGLLRDPDPKTRLRAAKMILEALGVKARCDLQVVAPPSSERVDELLRGLPGAARPRGRTARDDEWMGPWPGAPTGPRLTERERAEREVERAGRRSATYVRAKGGDAAARDAAEVAGRERERLKWPVLSEPPSPSLEEQLLTPEEREALTADLAEVARTRRGGEASGFCEPLA